jgi:hypothetical protein
MDFHDALSCNSCFSRRRTRLKNIRQTSLQVRAIPVMLVIEIRCRLSEA